MKNLENKNAENTDALKWYFENEKNLTILAKGKKNPIVKNWLDKLLPYSTITQYHNDGYNIGFVLSDTDLVVDCDPRNYKDGIDSLELLQNDLGVRLQDHAPTVRTGGGGYHFYFSKPSDLNINEVLDKYPGIEFKTEGRQVCTAGSLHPNGNYYKWQRNDIEQKELAPLLKLLRNVPMYHTIIQTVKKYVMTSLQNYCNYCRRNNSALMICGFLLCAQRMMQQTATALRNLYSGVHQIRTIPTQKMKSERDGTVYLIRQRNTLLVQF